MLVTRCRNAPLFDPAQATVVVPLDGSGFAEAALPTAVEFVGPAGQIVLVSVVEPPDHVQRDEFGRIIGYLDQQEESLTRELRDYLADVKTRLVHEYPVAARERRRACWHSVQRDRRRGGQ